MRHRDRGRDRSRHGRGGGRPEFRTEGQPGSRGDQRNEPRRDGRPRGGDDRHRRPRHRRRRDFFRRPREEQRRDWPPCPVCEKPVTELASAITHAETGKPAHFDCIMRQIETAEGLGANEKVCYLGKGSFGVIRVQKVGGNVPFIIRKRIQYENLEETPPWRKELDKYSVLNNRLKPAPAGLTAAPAAPPAPETQPPAAGTAPPPTEA